MVNAGFDMSHGSWHFEPVRQSYVGSSWHRKAISLRWTSARCSTTPQDLEEALKPDRPMCDDYLAHEYQIREPSPYDLLSGQRRGQSIQERLSYELALANV